MRWRSIAGTVEIDDMKPASAGVGEPAGDGDGLRREGGLAGEIALLQANDTASPEVDRREDLERRLSLRIAPCYRISTLLRYNVIEAWTGDMADDWRTPDIEALLEAILGLETIEETERFFRDLCTLTELRDMSQRWAVVRMLDSGLHYAEISRRTGASTATITRIASWLNHGEGGYRAMLDKLDAASRAGTRPYPIAGER